MNSNDFEMLVRSKEINFFYDELQNLLKQNIYYKNIITDNSSEIKLIKNKINYLIANNNTISLRSRFIYFCNLYFNEDYKNNKLNIYGTEINLVEIFNEDLSYTNYKILIEFKKFYNINCMLEDLLMNFKKYIKGE